MPITDYHQLIRTAVADVVKALDLGPEVTEVDDLEGQIPGLAAPGIAVACVGPEQNRPDFATNASDGIGFPVVVALLSIGAASTAGIGAKSPESPDLTAFRRAVTTAFHNKRLAGVPRVGYCEVSGDPLILDREGQAFQRLSTYLTVVAVGRFPRS